MCSSSFFSTSFVRYIDLRETVKVRALGTEEIGSWNSFRVFFSYLCFFLLFFCCCCDLIIFATFLMFKIYWQIVQWKHMPFCYLIQLMNSGSCITVNFPYDIFVLGSHQYNLLILYHNLFIVKCAWELGLYKIQMLGPYHIIVKPINYQSRGVKWPCCAVPKPVPFMLVPCLHYRVQNNSPAKQNLCHRSRPCPL